MTMSCPFRPLGPQGCVAFVHRTAGHRLILCLVMVQSYPEGVCASDIRPHHGRHPCLLGVHSSAATPRKFPPFITRITGPAGLWHAPTDEAFDLKSANG